MSHQQPKSHINAHNPNLNMPPITPLSPTKSTNNGGASQLEDFIHRANMPKIGTQEPSTTDRDSWELAFGRSHEAREKKAAEQAADVERQRAEAYEDWCDRDDWVFVGKTEKEKRAEKDKEEEAKAEAKAKKQAKLKKTKEMLAQGAK